MIAYFLLFLLERRHLNIIKTLAITSHVENHKPQARLILSLSVVIILLSGHFDISQRLVRIMSMPRDETLVPGARLLQDITSSISPHLHLERDSGTELYRQRSEEMQNPKSKRENGVAGQDQSTRRSANGYMPVR